MGVECIVIALFRPGQLNFVHYRVVPRPNRLSSSRLVKMARQQEILPRSSRTRNEHRYMADHVCYSGKYKRFAFLLPSFCPGDCFRRKFARYRHEKLKESFGNSTEKILRLIPNIVCRTLRSLNFPIYRRTYTRCSNVSS